MTKTNSFSPALHIISITIVRQQISVNSILATHKNLTLAPPIPVGQRATIYSHLFLSAAKSGASSHVSPRGRKSSCTVSLHVLLSLPRFLFPSPGLHVTAVRAGRAQLVRSMYPANFSRLSAMLSLRRLCPVLFRISSFVTWSFQVTFNIFLRHLW